MTVARERIGERRNFRSVTKPNTEKRGTSLLWVCEECYTLKQAALNPVECEAEGCDGEMLRAPDSMVERMKDD